jgi:hypothetical protein
MRDTTPYDEIDPAMRNLCRVLNTFPGIRTNHSCQGPIDGHKPNDPAWEVGLEIIPEQFAAGMRSMKALVWACTDQYQNASGRYVTMTLRAKAPLTPHLNDEPLYFIIEGYDGHPDELADALRNVFLPMLRGVWKRQDAR